MTSLEPLMRRNFLEYASYVIVDRAIPDLRDGLKPVQRRILATLAKMDDGKFHKVANVIGECMKLHPHGDASIGDALVVLANKEFFIERQGNFGNPVTGHSAAAPRYIECRLTDLAKETLFSKALTEYRPSYDGRNAEPVVLPAKLPVILMLGAEGIAVGMSTRILPHNFTELLRAQIGDPEERTGGGLPRLRAPAASWTSASTTTAAARSASARASRFRRQEDHRGPRDSLGHHHRPEPHRLHRIGLPEEQGQDRPPSTTSPPTGWRSRSACLAASTPKRSCLSSTPTPTARSPSPNMVMIRDRQPVETVGDRGTGAAHRAAALDSRGRARTRARQAGGHPHWLTLERIFIENRIYKRIEEATTAEAVKYEVYAGLEAFEDQLIRPVTDDDIERLLKIPIRRISQYDIDRNRDEIAATEKAIGEVGRKLKRLTATTIAYLEDLIERYGDDHPRRTEITTFEAVDVRAVARQNLRAAYDPETGFFGTAVKSEKYQLQMSEYDKVLIVSKDGSYRIIGPEEKFLVPGKAAHIQLFDPEEGARFTVVYRDAGRIAWAKKIHIRAFIHNREYELIKGRKGKLDLLLPGHTDDVIHMDFVPAKRQRVHEARFDLSILEEVGSTARGRRLAPKPVARLRKLSQADAEAERAAQREAAATAGPEAEVEVDEDQLGLFDEE
jgi:topoisomerase-4 subunit A